MNIAILRETRRFDDRRAAITPTTAKAIIEKWPSAGIFIQPSGVRVFATDEYIKSGVKVVEVVSDCDILVGVKEVAEECLIERKTYLMFAHVAKKQEHNRGFFKAMARKKITLIDYEYLTGNNGLRLVAFGFWAGIAGAYYAIKGILKRFAQVEIPHPFGLYNVNELYRVVRAVRLPPVKIVISGDGRVAQGAADVLAECGVHKVAAEEFLSGNFTVPVFCMLPFQEYVEPKPSSNKSYDEFFSSPSGFVSTFRRFTSVADVYIPCHFWHPDSPDFFTKEEMASADFKIRFVADISCDVPGPVPSTIRTSKHLEPFYDVDRFSGIEKPAFSGRDNITVLAVDNLPTALPRDASESFAATLLEKVFPSLLDGDAEGVVERATILKDGMLTPRFQYLEEWVKE